MLSLLYWKVVIIVTITGSPKTIKGSPNKVVIPSHFIYYYVVNQYIFRMIVKTGDKDLMNL